jgi:hypothetical protein
MRALKLLSVSIEETTIFVTKVPLLIQLGSERPWDNFYQKIPPRKALDLHLADR